MSNVAIIHAAIGDRTQRAISTRGGSVRRHSEGGIVNENIEMIDAATNLVDFWHEDVDDIDFYDTLMRALELALKEKLQPVTTVAGEWEPVSDGVYGDGIWKIKVNGGLIGIAPDDSDATFYGGNLPSGWRICRPRAEGGER